MPKSMMAKASDRLSQHLPLDMAAFGKARREGAPSELRTKQVDSTLDDSFPASDPVSWTGVISR
jgi:hypothetical protein